MNKMNKINKKILMTFLAVVFVVCLAGCGSDEKQTELINYINGDAFKEIGKLEKEMQDSYNSVSGDNYKSDEKMYKEIKDNTSVLARDLNAKALKLSEDLEDEKIVKVHKIYIDYTADFLSALNLMESALENQDVSKVSEANEKLNSSNQKGIDYRTELKKLAKEYDVEIKSE